ncbi:MAG: hypothetical protein ACPG7R_10190, partial [Planctomycetota bacterium]
MFDGDRDFTGVQYSLCWILALTVLLSVGCSTPDKTPDREDVLEDIHNTTLIPNLGSYDESIQ